MKAPPTIRHQRSRFDADNLAAAEVVLQDPERYGGDDALVVQWARAVLERQKQERRKLLRAG